MTNSRSLNVSLRNFTSDDLPLFKQWLYADHVSAWYTEPSDWVSEVADSDGQFDWISHYIVMAGDKPIGFCQYYPYWQSGEEWHHNIEISDAYSIDYMIGDPKYLHKGYGRAIVKMLIDAVTQHADAGKVIACPDSRNLASCRTLLSAGFMYDVDNLVYKYIL